MVKYQIFIKLTTYVGYIWYELDLGEFAPALNYESNNLAKLEDKLANYSQTVKLPCTPTNSRVFGYATAPTARPYAAYISFPCIILAGGVPVLPGEPELVLTGTTKDEFEVQILGTEMRVLSKLRELKFKDSPGYTAPDLGLGRAPRGFKKGAVLSNNAQDNSNTYNLPFTQKISPFARLVSAQNMDEDKSLMDWYRTSLKLPIPSGYGEYEMYASWRHAPVGVSVPMLINAIIIRTGVKIFYDTDQLDRLEILVTSNEADSKTLDLVDGINFRASGAVGTTNGVGGLVKWRQQISSTLRFPGMSLDDAVDDVTDIYYTPPVTGTYRIDYIYTTQGDGGTTILEIADLKGDNAQKVEITTKPEQFIDVELEGFTRYRLRYYSKTGAQNPPRAIFTLRGGDVTSGKVVGFGSLPIQKNLGFSDASELLTELCKALGLFIIVKGDEIHLFDAKNLNDNRAKALDWSSKLLATGLKKRFNIPGYGDINLIPFEDNKARTYTDSIELRASSSGFGDTKQLFKLKFEALPSVERRAIYRSPNNSVAFDVKPVAWTAGYKFDAGADSDGFLKYESSGKPYLVSRLKEYPEVVQSMASQFTGAVLETAQPKAQDYDRIMPASGKFLADNYYSRLTGGMIERPIMFEALLNLNAVDVYKFDPMVPVFIDRLGGYFYVNKIANFEAGEPTRVELIKLNDF